jgi:hypothetical protein
MTTDTPSTFPDPFDSHLVAAMHRHRQRNTLAKSMEQRLAVAAELYASAMASTQGNPVGRRAFIKRNHHKRSLSRVRQLELRMREPHA